MNKQYLLLCSALLLAGSMMVSCGGDQTQFEMPMVKYETKVLQPETEVYNMTLPATTVGTMEIKVYPQVDGVVTKRNYTPGTIVQKGQTLFVIDQTEYQLGVQSAEANSLQFVQTLYDAGNEVYRHKKAIETAEEKSGHIDIRVNALQEAFAATTELMNNGSTTYLEVLTAQESLLSAQLTQVENQYEMVRALISLYTALGGFWK